MKKKTAFGYRKLDDEEVIQADDIVAMRSHVDWPPTKQHIENLDINYLATCGYVKLTNPSDPSVPGWIGFKVKNTSYHVGRKIVKKSKEPLPYRKLEQHEVIQSGDIVADKQYIKWPPTHRQIKQLDTNRSPYRGYIYAKGSIGKKVSETYYYVGRPTGGTSPAGTTEDGVPLKLDWIDD